MARASLIVAEVAIEEEKNKPDPVEWLNYGNSQMLNQTQGNTNGKRFGWTTVEIMAW